MESNSKSQSKSLYLWFIYSQEEYQDNRNTEKENSLQKVVLGQLDITQKRMNLGPYLTPYENKLKMYQRPKLTHKSIKVSEENIGVNL